MASVSSSLQKLFDDTNRHSRLLNKQLAAWRSPGKAVMSGVPVQTVSVPMTKISEEKQPGVDKVVDCAETTVKMVEPLSGLNMKHKHVHGGACDVDIISIDTTAAPVAIQIQGSITRARAK